MSEPSRLSADIEDLTPDTSVRIVAWNAAKKTADKLPLLIKRLHPDVAVICECTSTDRVPAPEGTNLVWRGAWPPAGLGVLTTGPWSARIVDEVFDSRLQWVVPVEVDGPTPFKLLAVWQANQNATEFHPDWPLGRQVLAATCIYRDWLTGPLVVAGDFNHNVRWDRPRGKRNHRDTIDALNGLGCTSAYHRRRNCEQGQEPEATFYLHHNVDEGSHIDYVFVPTEWTILKVTVGSFERWQALSDHRPVTVDVAPGE